MDVLMDVLMLLESYRHHAYADVLAYVAIAGTDWSCW
jgi:hypothetical protein